MNELTRRPTPWNKGFTKETHPGVRKISDTFRARGINNFKNYQLTLPQPKELEKNSDLAEFMGVVLGDGHIARFPRTECLSIIGNSNNPGFIDRYANLVRTLFAKEPNIHAFSEKHAIRIRFYEKYISARLGIPTGNRSNLDFKIPEWIWTNRENLIRFLRGLYGAEGSFCVHKPTYTYKLLFANRNESLLTAAYRGVEKLGFHPHRSRYQIQLSRKHEVYECKELLRFRNY